MSTINSTHIRTYCIKLLMVILIVMVIIIWKHVKILDILAENISIYYSNCQCAKKIGIIYPGVNYDH